MKGRRRRPRPGDVLTALVLVLTAGLIALAVSPVHRQFYLGRLGREGGGPPAPARLPRAERPRSGDAPAGAARAVESIVATQRPRLALDADGWLRIPLADLVPAHLPAAGVPRGWRVWELAGTPTIELVRSEPGLALRLRSEQTSFALYRDVVVDLRELPILTWAWKVVRLPAGADVRQRATDDQAAQLYVMFPRWPALRVNTDVIGYVWDTSAPPGAALPSPQAPNVRIIVVESGPSGVGTWQRYARNVREDYEALFGRRPAPRVGGVAVMIDTNDTRGQAETLVADLAFHRAAAREPKIPTSMLR